jgi:TRAP-type C4-dicarboxylate transport system substrate-binding protein
MSFPKFRTTLSLAVAALALTLQPAANAASWKYAFEEALTDVQGVYAQKFKQHIESNSDHTVQLFPYGTLGESADIMEQTQAGILQFVDQSPGFTGSLIPEAQVFFVPYLLPQKHDNLVEFFRTSKAINQMFPKLYAEKNLHLLQMFPEGEVVMNTKKPVRTCSDLNEVKFRVMTNPLLVETYKAFGATPTPLAWGEVYGGLQTNIIQGQENPMFWVESTKMYEVTNSITFTGHSNFTTAVMANKNFYDGLDKSTQKLVDDAATAAFDHIVEYQKGLTEKSLKKIKDAKPSMTVIRQDEVDLKCFKEAAGKVEDKFVEMTGKSGERLLKQFKQDLKRVRN